MQNSKRSQKSSFSQCISNVSAKIFGPLLSLWFGVLIIESHYNFCEICLFFLDEDEAIEAGYQLLEKKFILPIKKSTREFETEGNVFYR